MAVVSTDFLAGALTNFRSTFNESFDASRNLMAWNELALTVNSTHASETHNWLGSVPVMVDVTHGDVELQGLLSFNYNIPNVTYKAGIEVDRSTFEDDALGLIRPKLAQLGEEAARHPGALMFLLAAANGNAFDGVSYFNATRKIGNSANIANTLTGSGTTLAQIQTDLATARGSMRKFQDDQGRPMNNTPNYIMIPGELEQVMYQALNITFPASSPNVGPALPATNDGTLTAAGYRVIVNPYLTDPNDWFLFHVSGSFRPFIYQTRIAPSLEGLTSPETESGVIRDRFVYTVRARYAVGYGDPRYGVRITN